MNKKSTGSEFRHELKYLLSPGAYHVLRNRLRPAVAPDPHGAEYRNTSLYFDDVYATAYRDKALGLSSRKKYRLRVYGLSDSRITLEEKLKEGNLVRKKAVRITPEEYKMLLDGDFDFLGEERFLDTAGQDFYTSDRLAALRPAVVVDYKREAYVYPGGNVRITFDKSLAVGILPDILDKENDFFPVLENGCVILEIKYDSFLPVFIKELFSGLPLTQESVSKFVYCTDKLRQIKPGGYFIRTEGKVI